MNTERIPEFGVKRENEERRDGGCGIVFDPKTQKYAIGKQHENGALRLFSGGVDANEDILADFELRNGNKDNDHWIYFMKKAVQRVCELGYGTI